MNKYKKLKKHEKHNIELKTQIEIQENNLIETIYINCKKCKKSIISYENEK